jgi:hypothetical protein
MALEEVAAVHSSLSITDAVGQRNLVSHRAPGTLAWEILDAHYGNARDRVPSRSEWAASHPQLTAEMNRRKRLAIKA